MNERPTQLAKKLVALEERMETRQAEYRTDIARLAEAAAEREIRFMEKIEQLTKDDAARDAAYRSDMAKRDAEYKDDQAKRDAQYRDDQARRDEAISATFARLEESIADLKVAIARMSEDFAKRETRIIVTVSGLLAAWMAVLTFIG